MSTTTDPRSIAFEILARHKSTEAADVLLQALGCNDAAAFTFIRRTGHFEHFTKLLDLLESNDEALNLAIEALVEV